MAPQQAAQLDPCVAAFWLSPGVTIQAPSCGRPPSQQLRRLKIGRRAQPNNDNKSVESMSRPISPKLSRSSSPKTRCDGSPGKSRAKRGLGRSNVKQFDEDGGCPAKRCDVSSGNPLANPLRGKKSSNSPVKRGSSKSPSKSPGKSPQRAKVGSPAKSPQRSKIENAKKLENVESANKLAMLDAQKAQLEAEIAKLKLAQERELEAQLARLESAEIEQKGSSLAESEDMTKPPGFLAQLREVTGEEFESFFDPETSIPRGYELEWGHPLGSQPHRSQRCLSPKKGKKGSWPSEDSPKTGRSILPGCDRELPGPESIFNSEACEPASCHIGTQRKAVHEPEHFQMDVNDDEEEETCFFPSHDQLPAANTDPKPKLQAHSLLNRMDVFKSDVNWEEVKACFFPSNDRLPVSKTDANAKLEAQFKAVDSPVHFKMDADDGEDYEASFFPSPDQLPVSKIDTKPQLEAQCKDGLKMDIDNGKEKETCFFRTDRLPASKFFPSTDILPATDTNANAKLEVQCQAADAPVPFKIDADDDGEQEARFFPTLAYTLVRSKTNVKSRLETQCKTMDALRTGTQPEAEESPGKHTDQYLTSQFLLPERHRGICSTISPSLQESKMEASEEQTKEFSQQLQVFEKQQLQELSKQYQKDLAEQLEVAKKQQEKALADYNQKIVEDIQIAKEQYQKELAEQLRIAKEQQKEELAEQFERTKKHHCKGFTDDHKKEALAEEMFAEEHWKKFTNDHKNEMVPKDHQKLGRNDPKESRLGNDQCGTEKQQTSFGKLELAKEQLRIAKEQHRLHQTRGKAGLDHTTPLFRFRQMRSREQACQKEAASQVSTSTRTLQHGEHNSLPSDQSPDKGFCFRGNFRTSDAIIGAVTGGDLTERRHPEKPKCQQAYSPATGIAYSSEERSETISRAEFKQVQSNYSMWPSWPGKEIFVSKRDRSSKYLSLTETMSDDSIQSATKHHKEWNKHLADSPGEATLFAMLRLVADAEVHLDEMRKRLFLSPAFEPNVVFKALHSNSNIPASSPITAVELRKWLAGFGIQSYGQDVEALVSHYSKGDDRLSLENFLQIVTPHDWVKSRDGMKISDASGSRMYRAKQHRAAQAQVSSRLAQLIERELEMLREVLARQQEIYGEHKLTATQALALLRSACGYSGAYRVAGYKSIDLERCSSSTDSLWHLSANQQQCLARRIGLSPDGTVKEEAWLSFMQLGDRFLPATPREITSFTKRCKACYSPVQRPFVTCPECQKPYYGAMHKDNTTSYYTTW